MNRISRILIADHPSIHRSTTSPRKAVRILASQRSYMMEYQPGLTPHLMTSKETILLHLLSDTGNKNKHLRPREGFLPVTDVKLRIVRVDVA